MAEKEGANDVVLIQNAAGLYVWTHRHNFDGIKAREDRDAKNKARVVSPSDADYENGKKAANGSSDHPEFLAKKEAAAK